MISKSLMVEVFKTNISEQELGSMLRLLLLHHFPLLQINFDLEDCDKILRVEGENFHHEEITWLMHAKGYQCEVLV